MAWVKVESSVSRHKKFIDAGPEASWLWVCGLCYAQEGLTDGFIPEQALHYLGVKRPDRLKDRLVAVRLWDAVPGGWQIHDYLEWNKDAASIRLTRERRANGGKQGGRPGGRRKDDPPEKPSETLEVSEEVNLPENPSTSTATSTAVATATPTASTQKPLDVEFRSFQESYPPHRRKGGWMAMTAFVDQVGLAGGVQPLMEALESHKASDQWKSEPRHIPNMDKWLMEERWRQRLDPPKPAAGSFGTWVPPEVRAGRAK